MSPYSTMMITREDAEFELSERGLSIPRSDEEIESKLFALFGDQTLHNFRVIHHSYAEDDWDCHYYRGRFSYVTTSDEVLSEESRPAKAYQFCPHCGEKL